MSSILELSRLLSTWRDLLIFLEPGGQKKLMGCGLLGGSAPRLTIGVNEKQKLWKEWKQGNANKEQYLKAGLILENKDMRVVYPKMGKTV